MSKKGIFTALILLITCLSLSAQNTFQTGLVRIPDQNGRSIPTVSIDNVKGDPFLYKDWFKGSVKISSQETYSNVDLKYNQVDDKLLFKNNEKAFELVVPVSEFTLSNGTEERRFVSGIPAVGDNTTKNFYEILVDGKTRLLKRTHKIIVETKGYNESTEKRYDKHENYFIMDDAKVYEIKPNKKAVLTAIKDYGLKGESIMQKGQNMKSESDLVEFIKKVNEL